MSTLCRRSRRPAFDLVGTPNGVTNGSKQLRSELVPFNKATRSPHLPTPAPRWVLTTSPVEHPQRQHQSLPSYRSVQRDRPHEMRRSCRLPSPIHFRVATPPPRRDVLHALPVYLASGMRIRGANCVRVDSSCATNKTLHRRPEKRLDGCVEGGGGGGGGVQGVR